jgi:hypothetical protein
MSWRAFGAALLLFASGLAARTAPAQAQTPEPTRVVIRAVARDAKIIGDGVGGALIRVVDAETGEMLAEGRQTGETGDTKLIMSTPRARGVKVYDTPGAGRYVAELSLTGPTQVNISAEGPLGYPQAQGSATKRMLLLPGRAVDGDGVVLELNGFIVEVQSPEPMAPVAGDLRVRARVRMMCGCPITPDGLWDANDIDVRARLLADGRVVAEAPLKYAGAPSQFAGTLEVSADLAERDLQLEVQAADESTENFGHHLIPVIGNQ